MRIVMDLQGSQNNSRFRGIGRYTMSLARHLVLAGGERHEIHLLLNRNLPDELARVAGAFNDLLPPSQIHIVELPKPTIEMFPENAWRTRAAELLREAALQALKPDLVHISSLFEGFDDNSVSSIDALGLSVPTAITLYDVIPLLQPDVHLNGSLPQLWYNRKAQFARRADLLLAISASSALEGCAALHLLPERVVTIGAGVDEKFRPTSMTVAEEMQLRQHYRLEQPFVLYVGAADPRKNLHGLMRAFARLPTAVRVQHRLVIAGKLKPEEKVSVYDQAAIIGLGAGEVILLNFIPDEDLIRLYSVCEVLVLPSLHEGFGLPAAEAMACGAAVIGSDRTSIPEVIGRTDALFDPTDPTSITERLTRVLTDPAFRDELRRHGPVQSSRFNWTDVAERGLAAFERLHRERCSTVATVTKLHLMPRVAFVSPLSVDPGSTASYTARLLPELATMFDLTSITVRSNIAGNQLEPTIPVRSHGWLREHPERFDHIIYELANGTATPDLLKMMHSHPGCALLHDTTISTILRRMSKEDATWLLYTAHGWHAALVANREGIQAAMQQFDCLLPFLAETEAVIVHSQTLAQHVRKCFHNGGPEVVYVQPPADFHAPPDRKEARIQFDLSPDGFVVCSLVLGDAEVQRHVLDGWLSMARIGHADMLLFACGQAAPDVVARVMDDIAKFGTDRIRLLQGIDASRAALAASDLVLQVGDLPGADAAVLLPDLLQVGASVLTGDAASWSALPMGAVTYLPPEPDGLAIAEALDHFRVDAAREARTAELFRVGRCWPNPGATAEEVRAALSNVTANGTWRVSSALVHELPRLQEPHTPEDTAMAEALAQANRSPAGAPCIFIDVSVSSGYGSTSEIQRFCHSVTTEMIIKPPPGYRVEPIRWVKDTYLYARQYVHGLFNLPGAPPPDEPVYAVDGDVYIGADLIMETVSFARSWFDVQRLRGMRTVFILYDLLPVRHPDMFPPLINSLYFNWITNVVELADNVVASSHGIMQDLMSWLGERPPQRSRPLQLSWLRVSSELETTSVSDRSSADAHQIVCNFRKRQTFVSAGTLGPFSGYLQALSAFDALWASGADVNFAIVGRRGWLDDDLSQQIETHPELGRRLFWFEDANDEVLSKIYSEATAFLALSEIPGFGLSVLDAAKFGLSIIARNIPPYHELTAGHASFFTTTSGPELAAYLIDWLQRHRTYDVPASTLIPYYSRAAIAEVLSDVAIGGKWSMMWEPREEAIAS